ncbi:protein kinase domain-containing protein [Anabaena sp. CCY 9402-a]|uniref:protein kinase domain-containing protein n=1 Tax=Anabaena sp. CCY 9402-a TaxID=3103867 RepID=UPI0039C635EC
MSLCINPHCAKPQNSDNILFCQACGSELLLQGRYRVIRQLGEGGFGKTFEASQNNTLKVLKVLTLDDSKAVSLFQQEARVLSQLNHPGIPKAEEYFSFSPRNSQSLLHCLVMEKIEGLDLHQYMEQKEKRPIDEKLAILWLTQLTKILHEVHQQNFFHRDIKPSNIMLKADGNLVLIDFGTAREITRTYYQKAAGQNITGIISLGYTPLEQANGKAVTQSDFFALGRTFVYLLTGKTPDEFSEDSQTGKLIWRDSAFQVSKSLAGLIDYLIEPFSGKRPQNAEMILKCISDINNSAHPSFTSASAVPSTIVKTPQNYTHHQIISNSQLQSSQPKNNKSSNHIAEFIGTAIGLIILILVKFGSRGLFKPFQSNPSQPVARSTQTEIQENNPELINSEDTSQVPSVSNKSSLPGVQSVLNSVHGEKVSFADNWVYITTGGSDNQYYIDVNSIVQEDKIFTYNKLAIFQYPNKDGIKAMIMGSSINCNTNILYEFDRLEIDSQGVVQRKVNLKEPGVSIVKSNTAGYSYWEYFCKK